jgi:chorismate mutase
MLSVRGIRGAIQTEDNTKDSILKSTKELLAKLVEENELEITDIASIFFTASPDLNAEYPAYAARDLGWLTVPLLCAREMEVPKGMNRVIRILMHVNTSRAQDQIKHQYLGETASLRPDLCGGNGNDNRDED